MLFYQGGGRGAVGDGLVLCMPRAYVASKAAFVVHAYVVAWSILLHARRSAHCLFRLQELCAFMSGAAVVCVRDLFLFIGRTRL